MKRAVNLNRDPWGDPCADYPDVNLDPYIERLVSSTSFAAYAAEECPDLSLDDAARGELHAAIERLSGWRYANLTERAEACHMTACEYERYDAFDRREREAALLKKGRADLASALRVHRDMAGLINDAIFKVPA